MNRLVAVLAVAALCTTGCSKKDEGGAGSTTTTSAKDCGADYADPLKEFCIKLPPGYTPGTPEPADALLSESIDFKSGKAGVYFTVSVGFSSASYKTYDEQMKSDEDTYGKTQTGVKAEANGATAGGGKWWVYTMGGNKRVQSDTKSKANKVIACFAQVDSNPEVIEACKSVRPYPK